MRATRWVTYHGAALNVHVDLAPFEDIIPCGIEDRDVSSVTKHIDKAGMIKTASKEDLMSAYSQALVHAFEDEFSLSVQSVQRRLDVRVS